MKAGEAIALFVPSMNGGGAERVMATLAREFADAGMHVTMILAQATGPFLKELPSSVQVVDLGKSRVLAALPKLTQYLRLHPPAALLSTMSHANLVAIMAARLAGRRTRVYVREANTLSRSAKSGASLKNRILPALIKRLYRSADGIIAVSEGVAADFLLTTGLPPSMVRTIYNPSVSDQLRSLAAQPLADPWFAKGSAPVVLGVGRLTALKDFATLIRAFAVVHKQRDVRLVILGEGEGRDQLQTLIDSMELTKSVNLAGFVDNPFSYMSRAAIFALSSRSEGLPNVLIQAMACGTPVVSTDCENGPREILAGGAYGALVPVGDAEQLAKAIMTALDAPISPAELRGRAQLFEAKVVARSYLDFLGTSARSSHG